MIGTLVGLFAGLGITVLWLFFNLQPPYANPRQVSVFNWTVAAVCAMLCLTFTLYVHQNLSPGGREKYFVGVAMAGSLGIVTVFLGVCFILRNFWIFKPR
jgi:hypothetical protein